MRPPPVRADYPTLGFNGDWIVVQTNVFTVSEGAFVASNIYAFNKADLYAGGAGQIHGVPRSDRIHRLPWFRY